MANHIIDAMLPNEQGDYHKIIHKISLHEGALINAGIFCIFCIYDIFNSDLDGDQLVDFYWIDPLFAAERIAAKSKYAGNLMHIMHILNAYNAYFEYIMHIMHILNIVYIFCA